MKKLRCLNGNLESQININYTIVLIRFSLRFIVCYLAQHISFSMLQILSIILCIMLPTVIRLQLGEPSVDGIYYR